MTTSEFIKMLQKADPAGDSHIRMGDGVPFMAELKAGYWDDLWEKAKSKFVFDLTYAIPEQRQERIDSFFNGLKEEFDQNKERHKSEWLDICDKVIALHFEYVIPKYELQFCDKCFQMTNHLQTECQKCKAKAKQQVVDESKA